MKVGDLVLLQGSIVSSYGREGQMGLLLEIQLLTNRNGQPDAEFSRVMWEDGQSRLYKSEHLQVVNESR